MQRWPRNAMGIGPSRGEFSQPASFEHSPFCFPSPPFSRLFSQCQVLFLTNLDVFPGSRGRSGKTANAFLIILILRRCCSENVLPLGGLKGSQHGAEVLAIRDPPTRASFSHQDGSSLAISSGFSLQQRYQFPINFLFGWPRC